MTSSNYRPTLLISLALFLGMGLLLVSCGDDQPTNPELNLQAPGPIQNLRVTQANYTSIDLAWEAPVDSGTVAVESIQIRYFTEPMTPENFYFGESIYIPPTDSTSVTQHLSVKGLSPGTYYFASRSFNTQTGVGGLSNQASGSLKRIFHAPEQVANFNCGEVAFGDFNGDGAMDVAAEVVGPDFWGIRIYENTGMGTFSGGFEYDPDPSDWISSMVSADFNGDGLPDLAAHLRNRGLVVLQNLGGAAFTDPTSYRYITGSDLVAGDFDGDHDQDLAMIITGWGVVGWIVPGVVQIKFNDGFGSFSEPDTIAISNHMLSGPLFCADLDGDMDPDLLYRDGPIISLINENSGTLWTEIIYSEISLYTFLGAPAHLNEDGFLDLITGNYSTTTVLLNDKTGGFLSGPEVNFGASFGFSAAEDFNGDGLVDFVTVGGGLYLYMNGGDGKFEGAANYGDLGAKGVHHLDMDGDGDIDLLVAHEGGISVLYNDVEPLD